MKEDWKDLKFQKVLDRKVLFDVIHKQQGEYNIIVVDLTKLNFFRNFAFICLKISKTSNFFTLKGIIRTRNFKKFSIERCRLLLFGINIGELLRVVIVVLIKLNYFRKFAYFCLVVSKTLTCSLWRRLKRLEISKSTSIEICHLLIFENNKVNKKSINSSNNQTEFSSNNCSFCLKVSKESVYSQWRRLKRLDISKNVG